jgi:phosphoglycolate phosphatase-like HAD superfamily hydrolase
MDFIGVTTGTHTAAELREAGAKRVCANLPEVSRAFGL